MITVSRDIISKSVAPNKTLDMIRRDSDGDDYMPRNHKKRKNRNSKRNNRDPFHQISMDDLNRDSDEEAEEALSKVTKNKSSTDTLGVTTASNTFDKQTVSATPAPKSALSAMMELTRDALNADAAEFEKRRTIAMNRYTKSDAMPNLGPPLSRHNSSQHQKNNPEPNGHRQGGKRRTIHDQQMMMMQGRQKRGTIRGRDANAQNTDTYYDSSDSDEMRVLANQQRGNPLDKNIEPFSSQGQQNMNTILVYIEEFKNDQPYRVSTHKKQNAALPKTANDIIIEVYNKCVDNNRILKGASVSDYVLREWDDDEPGDFRMDGSADISKLNWDAVCICYAGPGGGTVKQQADNKLHPRSQASLANAATDIIRQKSSSPDLPDDARQTRAVTLEYLNTKYEKVFVRIQVPGPMNDTFTFQIDHESAALNVRDLCMSLNKKKNQIYFNPQYFDFYYQGLTSTGLEGPINKQTKVLDLKKKDLVILPKIINPDDSTEEKERAFAFPLVKLANEVSKFKAFKIKNSQKKARILSVDRYRIVKQSLEDEKFKIMRRNEKVPIDITAITSIKINSENNAQFILNYNHPNGGNRKHVYEMASKQECSHCVSKIKYLVTLRRLQG